MPKTARTPKVNINLLYPMGLSDKLPTKFLKWALHYGRFIVIMVEIIVLVCFAYRFKLDLDLDSTNNKINQQINVVEQKSKDEQLIRQTQQTLALIKKNYDINPKWKETADKIALQTPQTSTFNGLSIDTLGNSLQFKVIAQTNNYQDMAVFVSALRGESAFTNVNLGSINYEAGAITYTISGEVK